MFSIMLFIFLCFLGMLAVLYHMLRSQEKIHRVLRDEHAQMRELLNAMELRLDALDAAHTPAPLSNARPSSQPAVPTATGHLMHLDLSESTAAPRETASPNIDPALDLHFDPAIIAVPPLPDANGR